jgi:hypothetical protein
MRDLVAAVCDAGDQRGSCESAVVADVVFQDEREWNGPEPLGAHRSDTRVSPGRFAALENAGQSVVIRTTVPNTIILTLRQAPVEAVTASSAFENPPLTL